MKQSRTYWLLAILILSVTACGEMIKSVTLTSVPEQQSRPAAVRVVDLKASDGTLLKGSYFAAAKPGRGILLLHQVNRTRKDWNDVAEQLAAAGINTLSLDTRGYGEGAGSAPADIVYARPGQLVDAGGFRLNLYCMGSGSPTVVFDSGWEDWAPAWAKVQPEIAKWTRACSYDRAGAGFSEPGPMPRTSERIAKELHTALHNAGIRGPYILAGAAFGGDNMRAFADRYMPEVAGLVMVDADPDEFAPQAMREEQHRRDVGIISQLRACRNTVADHKPLPMLPPRPGRPQRTCAQQFFRGLPEAEWSRELNAKLLEIAQTNVAMYDAYISEMEQTPWDERYLQQHRRSFGARPIRVLTSGNHGVGHLETKPADTPEHIKYEQETTLAQARWLGLSSNAKQIFARHSSEYIQFDEPETVITAIREVYDDSRKRVVGNRLMTLTPPFSICSRSQDCYADSYANAPADGSAAETGNACLRVDRGASWFYSPWLLRAATRERNPADYRDVMMGFRLARSLP